jgi:anti-anti-sigma factor
MEISEKKVDSVSVVGFVGSLDTNTASDAQQFLEGVQGEGVEKICVDFSDLDYISSAGLRVLLVTAKSLGASGGSLRLFGLNEMVSEVFEISGFSVILKVFASEEEALQDF